MPDETAIPDVGHSSEGSLASKGSLGAVVDTFRNGMALVEAALAALTRVSAEIEAIRDMIPKGAVPAAVETSLAMIRWHLDAATIGGDNLLVARNTLSPAKPLLLVALSKSASGALTTQTISIERDALILAGEEPGASAACDRLESVLLEDHDGAARLDATRLTRGLETLSARVAAATSRLSVIKVRLALQSSFVTSVAEADTSAPLVRLDSHVNHADARDLALETRRLLSRQSLCIGTSNRLVLQTLFQRHES